MRKSTKAAGLAIIAGSALFGSKLMEKSGENRNGATAADQAAANAHVSAALSSYHGLLLSDSCERRIVFALDELDRTSQRNQPVRSMPAQSLENAFDAGCGDQRNPAITGQAVVGAAERLEAGIGEAEQTAADADYSTFERNIHLAMGALSGSAVGAAGFFAYCLWRREIQVGVEDDPQDILALSAK